MTAPGATVNQLAAALRYAALGWPVFPLHTPVGDGCSCADTACKSTGKHPRTSDGFKAATTEEARIRSWWRTWPTANIGIATGARSGLFALDVDPDKGGSASLEVLLSKHGDLPQTVDAITGSGGRHVLFRHPGRPIPNSTQRLGPGLDVRGDGGYIVAAPSLHRRGTTYEWHPGSAPGQREPANAPEWLLELLRPAPLPAGLKPITIDRAYARAQAYIARMPQAISGSGGHDSLWNVALACIRGFRLSESEAVSLLIADYNPRCDPPWSEKEIIHKLRDAEGHAQVPYGYLLDAERKREPPPTREPGDDDDEPELVAQPTPSLSIGVADFFATCKDQIEWLLEPYVCKGGFTLVQGAPKCGKTWLVAWIAACVAARGGRVLFVEEEGAAEVLRDRLRPFVGDGAAHNSNLLVAFRKRIKLDLTKSVEALIAEVRRTGAALVVLDPFIALHSKREKESDEMAMVLDSIRQLITETGCAVLLVHHTRKGDSWNKGSTADASSEDARGSGSIIGDVDHVIAVRALPAARRTEGEVAFYVENPDTRLKAPFGKKLVTFTLSDGTLKESAAESETTEDLLVRMLSILPREPQHVAQQDLRKALRVAMDRVREAVYMGTEKGLLKTVLHKGVTRLA